MHKTQFASDDVIAHMTKLESENAELKRKLAAYEAFAKSRLVAGWLREGGGERKFIWLPEHSNDKDIPLFTLDLDVLPTTTEHLEALLQQAREEEREKMKGIAIGALLAAENAFITQVGTDYNDIIHAAYLQCKSAIEAIRKGDTQ